MFWVLLPIPGFHQSEAFYITTAFWQNSQPWTRPDKRKQGAKNFTASKPLSRLYPRNSDVSHCISWLLQDQSSNIWCRKVSVDRPWASPLHLVPWKTVPGGLARKRILSKTDLLRTSHQILIVESDSPKAAVANLFSLFMNEVLWGIPFCACYIVDSSTCYMTGCYSSDWISSA